MLQCFSRVHPKRGRRVGISLGSGLFADTQHCGYPTWKMLCPDKGQTVKTSLKKLHLRVSVYPSSGGTTPETGAGGKERPTPAPTQLSCNTPTPETNVRRGTGHVHPSAVVCCRRNSCQTLWCTRPFTDNIFQNEISDQ